MNTTISSPSAPSVGAHTSHRRATLCRCGQSQRKPYCDGSHVAAAFVASEGE